MARDVLSNHHNTAMVPLLQHEMGQGRDAAMHRVSLVIQLIKVYVEPIFPWDLGAQRLGTGNCSLVVLVRESRDVIVGDLAALPGKLKRPEGTMAIRRLAVLSRYA